MPKLKRALIWQKESQAYKMHDKKCPKRKHCPICVQHILDSESILGHVDLKFFYFFIQTGSADA